MKTFPIRAAAPLALACALAAAAAQAQEPMTEAQVRATLEAEGYTNVDDIAFEGGMWEADASSADGNRVDLRIDPASGEVYPEDQVSNLTGSDIEARLSAAGYTNIHDIDFEDGLWRAEADDANGQQLELRIDPRSGEVIGSE
ncbi:PepSY domain-containing protein [Luteimonas sp. RD2P54]|uniref:PepSY domain-containing protein n=1 Tax=Luteimonas endophytica TaxID=3042023 RepID=A0ABT6JD85_9GAMM|nr:PepSY domain-containing protein [Luteimonas endophytica]MDH5824791.1 PepSY domain-containing protein [Luteimonas endophytica]